ncbi:hypothetical protein ACBI99_44850 [Nonomuraea sp. ATR24]|uniref:hypothetical protein n=1 Tax=Nonomuraea sp. ATR24 TaxID=1676744 RepID=UPI0035C0BE4E
MTAVVPRCSHGRADPGMCLECRRERLTGRPMPPPVTELAAALADSVAPGREIAPGQVDHARLLSEDLQRVLGRVGYLAMTVEDAIALWNAAHLGVPPSRGLLVRVAEAIAEARTPGLIGANDVPHATPGSDHGREPTTTLTSPPTG